MDAATHYPGYDVMREEDAWDDHTREIVRKRLEPPPPPRFLTQAEVETLSALAAALVDDAREEIAAYVTGEIDRSLAGGTGEDQRKPGIPPQADLMRRGLAAVEDEARRAYGGPVPILPLDRRRELLGRIEREEMPADGAWRGLPQKEFFRKLLGLVVEAYYSHPAVWPEIGYGGPAYPRGYVRVELGLADPWEANRAEAERPSDGEAAR